MRFLSLLIALVAVGYTFQAESIVADQSFADLYQEVLNVEASLREQLKAKYNTNLQKKKEEQLANQQALNSSIQAFQNKLKERTDAIKAAAQEVDAAKDAKNAKKKEKFDQFVTELREVVQAAQTQKANEEAQKKEEYQELAEQLKSVYQKLNEKKQAREQEEITAVKTAIEKIEQKFNDFKTKVDTAIKERETKRQQKYDEAKKSLTDLKNVVDAEMQARADRKAKHQAEYDANKQQYKTDITQQKLDLDADEQKLMDQYKAFQTKKDNLRQTIKNAIKETANYRINSVLGDKIQEALDAEAINIVAKDQLREILFPTQEQQIQNIVNPEGKATILDEITGTSQWQTVTWILLALAIILSIALVGMIFYNVSQRNNYQRLNGHDEESRPANENTPISRAVSNPVGYSGEKKISVPSSPVTPMAPPLPVVPAGPSEVVPLGEQQF